MLAVARSAGARRAGRGASGECGELAGASRSVQVQASKTRERPARGHPQQPQPRGPALRYSGRVLHVSYPYSFKYAQFCHTDDYVITTVFCRRQTADGEESKGELTHSRVVIARRSPVKIWDVTAVIEDLLGESRGTLAAQFGTCGPST